ncbi:hypothetical protein GALL_441580 [mine drainage metagenome]|uniref:Uncharacterized protein n=1 Tax=mine drainage metagenome TaxID=410659 RepID=A0A1J5PRG5_9ZZZZ
MKATGTEAKASLTSNASMSSTFMPARFSARAVAGIGASSMITGSCPMTDMWWTRASGFTPSSFRPFSDTTITPEAPSQIWLEDAAVSRPFSRSSFTPLMPSRLASKRMPSSTVCSVLLPSASVISIATISFLKAPAWVAAMAR